MVHNEEEGEGILTEGLTTVEEVRGWPAREENGRRRLELGGGSVRWRRTAEKCREASPEVLQHQRRKDHGQGGSAMENGGGGGALTGKGEDDGIEVESVREKEGKEGENVQDLAQEEMEGLNT